MPDSELSEAAKSMSEFFMTKPIRCISNVLVMTADEAEKIWDAGVRAKTLENNPDAKWINFKSWMEYKGIKI
jgi:hypothetical protein